MKRIPVILIFISLVISAGVHGQDPSPYRISRLPFNLTPYSEISPVLFEKGIFFCSDRRISGVMDRTSFDNRRLYNIYKAERKDSTEWGKPEMVRSERTAQFNTGPLCISPDGATVWFTSEIETGEAARSRKFRNHSGIFTARLSGTELTDIQPFRYNSPDYDIAQPSLSNDGKFLFFASDMPGGQGKSDIWYCELVSGEWAAPVNPGPVVNSPESDNFPLIHSSGRLYFASNRSGGSGGLDVYSTSFSNGVWEMPERLPEPVNSTADDFAFVPQNDLQSGYFSSNRRRNDDIFEFTATIIRKSQCSPLEINNYCFEFVEENAVKYDTIPFRFEWNFGDGEKAEGRLVEHCYSKPGSYLVRLDVTNLVTNEVKLNEKSHMLMVEAVEQPYITCPDTAPAVTEISFSADSTNLPGWEIDRYYWNFGDGTIATGPNVEKTYRNPGEYNIQLIVTAKPGPGGMIRETCVSKNISVVERP
ncbi:MAG: PKD domain-containing protein [Bacteroidales bacterium]|jgi:chitodextrinase|nr:PKD domain-containing protein [Bacteroidales bacterium]